MHNSKPLATYHGIYFTKYLYHKYPISFHRVSAFAVVYIKQANVLFGDKDTINSLIEAEWRIYASVN